MNTITVDMEMLKARLKATWMSGDYGYFARYLEPGALKFLERIAIKPGVRVLDVACGAGQISIPAARIGAQVTGIDIATNLIEQARSRTRAEGLSVQFDEGDAEMLPYEDASFDVVVSLIGAMFAPQPEKVAAELVRVCRPGGQIVMGNWTAEGFVGQMFKIIGKYVPPPPFIPSPLKWGDEETVRARFSTGISDLHMVKRLYPFHYPFPPVDVVEFFRQYYGPMNRAFAALDNVGQEALQHDLTQLWKTHNLSKNGFTVCKPEYLEVVAIRDPE